MSEASPSAANLPEATRRLHRALMQQIIDQGAIPAATHLAAAAGMAVADLPHQLRALALADYLALDGAGRLTCLYPFSISPTPHAVNIGGERRHAMCAIDALGIPAMLERKLDIAGRCAVCETPIALTVRPGSIEMASPATAMVAARRDEAEPAFAACCPFTVFVCGQDHATAFARRISGVHILPLTNALAHAEEIFGGLLAETLPSSRPRGREWGGVRHSEPIPILFTQAGCAESAQVRSWLRDRGIVFTERDVSRDRDAASALVATGTFATPLLVAGDEQILGFRPAALAALIDRRERRKREGRASAAADHHLGDAEGGR